MGASRSPPASRPDSRGATPGGAFPVPVLVPFFTMLGVPAPCRPPAASPLGLPAHPLAAPFLVLLAPVPSLSLPGPLPTGCVLRVRPAVALLPLGTQRPPRPPAFGGLVSSRDRTPGGHVRMQAGEAFGVAAAPARAGPAGPRTPSCRGSRVSTGSGAPGPSSPSGLSAGSALAPLLPGARVLGTGRRAATSSAWGPRSAHSGHPDLRGRSCPNRFLNPNPTGLSSWTLSV